MYKTFCQLSKLVFQLEKGSYEFSSEELHFSNDSSAINYSWAMEKKKKSLNHNYFFQSILIYITVEIKSLFLLGVKKNL